MATYNDIFLEIYGTPEGTMKAYVLEMPSDITNPIKVLAGNIPKGAKATVKDNTLYVLANTFNHPSAIQLFT